MLDVDGQGGLGVLASRKLDNFQGRHICIIPDLIFSLLKLMKNL